MVTSLRQPLAARFLSSLAQFRTLGSASVHQEQEPAREVSYYGMFCPVLPAETKGGIRGHTKTAIINL